MTRSLISTIALFFIGCVDGGPVFEPNPADDSMTNVGPQSDAGVPDPVLEPDAATAADERPTPPDQGGGACCISQEIQWHLSGGLSYSSDRHALTGCGAFQSVRTYASDAMPPELCATELPPCGDSAIDAGDLREALVHEDVVNADDQLYGGSTLVPGGTVTRITIGSRTIAINQSCSADCSEVPEGIAALSALLDALAVQERTRGGCE